MKSPQPPLDKNSILLALWSTATAITIVLYWNKVTVALGSAKNACELSSLGDALLASVQPSNWFGLLTVGFTLFGVWHILKFMGSKWPNLADLKWVALLTLAFIVGAVLGFGCK